MKEKTLLRLLTPLVIIATILGGYLFAKSNLSRTEAAQSPSPKYIFIFLAHGAGITHLEIARQYSRHIHNEGLIIPEKIMKEGSLGKWLNFELF